MDTYGQFAPDLCKYLPSGLQKQRSTAKLSAAMCTDGNVGSGCEETLAEDPFQRGSGQNGGCGKSADATTHGSR